MGLVMGFVIVYIFTIHLICICRIVSAYLSVKTFFVEVTNLSLI